MLDDLIYASNPPSAKLRVHKGSIILTYFFLI